MTYTEQYHQLIETLADFPETYIPSPVHSVDPARSVYAMMNHRVAADFYWAFMHNRNRRFLCIEADMTGDSSDTGDVVMYGLTYLTEAHRWTPMYVSLRELAEHECVILPLYDTPDGRGATIRDALMALAN